MLIWTVYAIIIRFVTERGVRLRPALKMLQRFGLHFTWHLQSEYKERADRHIGSVVDETLRSVSVEVTLQKFSIDTLATLVLHFT